MRTSVANGAIDKLDLEELGSSKIVSVFVANLDNLTARFSVVLLGCKGITSTPPVYEFSLTELSRSLAIQFPIFRHRVVGQPLLRDRLSSLVANRDSKGAQDV